jgi:uncharacterized protein YybS (DUF2232 family)
MAAVTVLLALINMYVPFLGIVAIFVLPVPVVLVQLRYGMRQALLTAIVSGILLAALVGPVEALLLFSFFGIIGLTFGHAFRRGLSPAWAVMAGTVAVSLSWAISMLMTFLVLNLSPIDMLNRMYDAMTAAFAMYEQWNLISPEARAQLVAAWELMRDQAYHILPASFAIGAAASSYLTYQLIRPVLGRLGHRLEPFPGFSQWKAPSYFILGLVVELAFALTYPRHGSEVLLAVGSNVGTIVRITFAVMGVSLASWLLQRWGVHKLVRTVAVWFLVFNPLLQQVAMLAGAFDAAVDYRRAKLAAK